VDETDRLDVSARAVRIDGRPVPLTRLEFGLLQFLHERSGEAVPRDVLRREIWGHRGGESSNVVDVVVRSLRRKLGVHSSTIESIRGIGYRYAS
jgi:DNA-binding response OmpR family regulator